MTDDWWLTLAHAARIVGRPAATVRQWAEWGRFRVRWSKNKRLARLGDVRAVAARMDAEPKSVGSRGRANPGAEPTAAELDALIAERMAALPSWWWAEVERMNGAEFARAARAEYEAKQRRAA